MPGIQSNYRAPIVIALNLVLAVTLLTLTTIKCWAAEDAKKISVHFNNTPLAECVSVLLKLADSPATIKLDPGLDITITKTAVDKQWNSILKEILVENNLKLTKHDGEYRLSSNTAQALSSAKQTSNINRHIIANDEEYNTSHCNDKELITLGYKYSSGANPYALVGHCVKIKNVKPFQYFSATEALARWSYRSGYGVVYIEDRSKKNVLSNARVLITESIGVYEYGTTLGSKQIIPHLIIR